MVRWLLAVLLVSCGTPTSVIATPPPSTTPTQPAAAATRLSTPTARSSPTPEPTGLAKCVDSHLWAVAAGTSATAPRQCPDYCADILATSFRVTPPDGGGVIDGSSVDLGGKALSRFGAPPCDDASGPSTLVVYPFQEPVR